MAVLSGKGGVGKSNLSVNLSLSMAEKGKRVILLDADLGMANVDLLCGVTPKFTLAHLVRGEKSVEDVLLSFSENMMILPGGPGVQELAELDESAQSVLIDKLSVLEGMADILMIDTGAGIHKNTLSFAAAADATLLVTTPEPTSIRDAYGVLKALAITTASKIDVTLVVNMASSRNEGAEAAERIQMAAAQFLGLSAIYGGTVVRDETVGRAVRNRTPFFLMYPDSPAAECIRAISDKLLGGGVVETSPPSRRGVKSFFFRLARGLGLG